jgi:endonuclease/exonuclease/phosphatase family metal-dependent hydrolase
LLCVTALLVGGCESAPRGAAEPDVTEPADTGGEASEGSEAAHTDATATSDALEGGDAGQDAAVDSSIHDATSDGGGDDAGARPWVSCEESPAGCTAETGVIRVDGRFDDWQGREPWLVDSAEGGSDIDIQELWVAHDDAWIFLRFRLGEPINLQEDNGLTLLVDADDDPATGDSNGGLGVELEWTFGQRRGWYYQAGQVFDLSAELAGVFSAPSVASAEFEVALRKEASPVGNVAAFTSDALAIRLVDRPWTNGGDRLPNDAAAASLTLPAAEPSPAPISLVRSASTALRVVSYNTLQSGILYPERAVAFRRILAALDPDVVALQECYDVNGADAKTIIDAWLPLPGATWNVRKVGELIVASRVPVLGTWTAPPLNQTQALLLEPAPGLELLLLNAHFSCCEKEAQRQVQADGVVSFVRNVRDQSGGYPISPDAPLLLVGDLNLVGTPKPLQTLLTGQIVDTTEFGPGAPMDADGSAMTDLLPRHVNHPLTFTFRVGGESTFSPGTSLPSRLDYAIYSDSNLEVARRFTLDTAELTPGQLEDAGLLPNDTAVASDHRPVVLDLMFAAKPQN